MHNERKVCKNKKYTIKKHVKFVPLYLNCLGNLISKEKKISNENLLIKLIR